MMADASGVVPLPVWAFRRFPVNRNRISVNQETPKIIPCSVQAARFKPLSIGFVQIVCISVASDLVDLRGLDRLMTGKGLGLLCVFDGGAGNAPGAFSFPVISAVMI